MQHLLHASVHKDNISFIHFCIHSFAHLDSISVSVKYVSLPDMSDVCLTFTMQFYKGLHSIDRQISDVTLPHFAYTGILSIFTLGQHFIHPFIHPSICIHAFMRACLHASIQTSLSSITEMFKCWVLDYWCRVPSPAQLYANDICCLEYGEKLRRFQTSYLSALFAGLFNFLDQYKVLVITLRCIANMRPSCEEIQLNPSNDGHSCS